MKAKFVNETMNFRRGLEPKEAMGIGKYGWHNGWRLVQDAKRELTPPEKYAIESNIASWSRKATEPDDVRSELKVTNELGDILENLPIIDFKSYYSMPGKTGLFVYDEWPVDFPNFDLFVSNVEEDDGTTYLVNPSGYRYARYITKLV